MGLHLERFHHTVQAQVNATTGETKMNAQHFSNRSAAERRAMHAQMRDMARCDACDNSNVRPWNASDARAFREWADSRASEPAFAEVVAQARFAAARFFQENAPRVVR
jgi:hypothetical protein